MKNLFTRVHVVGAIKHSMSYVGPQTWQNVDMVW